MLTRVWDRLDNGNNGPFVASVGIAGVAIASALWRSRARRGNLNDLSLAEAVKAAAEHADEVSAVHPQVLQRSIRTEDAGLVRPVTYSWCLVSGPPDARLSPSALQMKFLVTHVVRKPEDPGKPGGVSAVDAFKASDP